MKLELGRNPFGEEGAAAIAAAAAAGGLSRLEELNLGSFILSFQIRRRWRASPRFRLRWRGLSRAEEALPWQQQVGDAGILAFAAALEKGGLPKLKKCYSTAT